MTTAITPLALSLPTGLEFENIRSNQSEPSISSVPMDSTPMMYSPTTGSVDFVVDQKTYQTWYKIFGDPHSGNRKPLVVLHGGPGLSHDYMLPNSALFSESKIPVILYDQLGCGKSTHIPDAPQSFWSVELYMDELDNLLDSLGISGSYDLLGHSWGGMLAANYAAARKPPGLKHLILTNCPASTSLVTAGILKRLIEGFPTAFLEMIQQHEAAGTTESQEYKDGKRSFAQKNICTLDPWPPELLASFAEHEKDPSVHKALMGGYLLTTKGNLKNWDVTPILHQISCPTLLLHSPTDEVHEIAVTPFFENIPKVKWVEFYHSSHLAQFEEPERYFKVVTQFLS